MTRNRERQAGNRPRSIFERQWVGWAIAIALGLLALAVLAVVLAALPLLVIAFPLTIAALLVVLAVAYLRERRRDRRQRCGDEP